MKTWKILILVAILAIVLVGFNSCRSQKEVPQEKEQPVAQEVQKPKLSIWTQDLDENLSEGDPINFFNQFKIIVIGKIPIKVKSYVDGKFALKDSSINFNFTIPAETKGKIKKIERKMGKPSSVIVEFVEGDPNYCHTFNLQADKSYCVGGKTTIFINNQPYQVGLSVDGDGSGKCHMMFDSEYSSSESNIGGPAMGVPDVIGTKVIKK